MKYCYFFFLILFLAVNNYGQNPADTIQFSKSLHSLENKSKVTNSDIDKMLKITDESRAAHPDFTLRHLQKIKRLIEKNEYYTAFTPYVNQIVFIYSGKTEMRKAEKILTEIYNKHEDNFDEQTKGSVRFQFATIASDFGEYEKSQKILNEILPDAASGLKASIYFQRGRNYSDLGNYKQALSDCLKSIDLYTTKKDYNNLSTVLDLVNVIYQHLGQYDKALIYSKKAINVAEKANNIDNIMGIYSNMGVIYKYLNKIDSAEYAYNKAIEMGKKYDRPSIVAQNLLNLGNILTDSHRFKEAEQHFLNSLEICREMNIAEGVLMNYISLGNNEFTAENYSKAEFFYKKALEESKKMDEIPEYLIPIYAGLTDLYEIKGDYKNAFEYFKKYQEITEKVNIEQSKKDVAAIQGKYDTAIKDAEIERINKDYELKESENKTLIYLIVFGLILTASWILFLTFRNKQLKLLYKKNVELLNTKQFPVIIDDTEDIDRNGPLKKVFSEINNTLENEKIYQNPILSISDVAQLTNSNQKYVSSAIANYANMNFSNFINLYRINEAKKLIISQEHQTLNEIMYASGFNSRTTFYNAFTKFTGMSPKKFKDISMSLANKNDVEILEEAEVF